MAWAVEVRDKSLQLEAGVDGKAVKVVHVSFQRQGVHKRAWFVNPFAVAERQAGKLKMNRTWAMTVR